MNPYLSLVAYLFIINFKAFPCPPYTSSNHTVKNVRKDSTDISILIGYTDEAPIRPKQLIGELTAKPPRTNLTKWTKLKVMTHA